MTKVKKPMTWVRLKKNFLKWYQLYLIALPALVATFIFSYIPMYGVQIAFRNFRFRDGIRGSQWVWFANFERLFAFPGLWPMVRNTLTLSLYAMATFPLAIILALMLNELRSLKFKKTVQMISYAPFFLSTVVVAGMTAMFLSRFGLFNNIRYAFGLERIQFMQIGRYFRHIYVWSGVWSGIGWGSIIYIAALAGVSPELTEAARIDGALRRHIIWHVNIPAIMPTIVIMFILSSGNIMNVGFERILLLQNDLTRPDARVIQTFIYEVGVVGSDFSFTAAFGLLNNLVNITLLLIVNAIAKKLAGVGIW